MRHRRARRKEPADWPPALRQIVRSAQFECPSGHADALVELIALAFHKVPSRGIFDPTARGEEELFTAIESVAGAHLELRGARAAWRAALGAATLDAELREELERAAMEVQAISDTAYFYAGLAFGLTATLSYGAGSR